MPGKKMIYEIENSLLQIFVHILGLLQARMMLHHQILHKSKARWRTQVDESCQDPRPKLTEASKQNQKET